MPSLGLGGYSPCDLKRHIKVMNCEWGPTFIENNHKHALATATSPHSPSSTNNPAPPSTGYSGEGFVNLVGGGSLMQPCSHLL